jgi:hypothetical protein
VSCDIVFDEQAKWQWGEAEDSDDSAGDTWAIEYNLSCEQVVVDGAAEQEEEPVPADGIHEAEGDDIDQCQDESVVSENLDADKGDSVLVCFRRLDDIVAELDNHELQLHVLSSDEPATFDEAEYNPYWRRAMEEEISSIEENKTWTLCELSQGRQAIGLKWVFKVKRDEHGSVVRHKVRLVVKGYAQRRGVDYDEVFGQL